jgi:hypothetical protein
MFQRGRTSRHFGNSIRIDVPLPRRIIQSFLSLNSFQSSALHLCPNPSDECVVRFKQRRHDHENSGSKDNEEGLKEAQQARGKGRENEAGKR